MSPVGVRVRMSAAACAIARPGQADTVFPLRTRHKQAVEGRPGSVGRRGTDLANDAPPRPGGRSGVLTAMDGVFVRRLALTLCGVGLTALGAAQEPVRSSIARSPETVSPPGLDPYTRGKEDDLERAGYVRTAPFPIGGYHGTAEIDALIGEGRMRWIETAHFRIGAELPAESMKSLGKDVRARLRADLAAAQRRLPRVDVETDELDPWLRTHLLAQWCEQSYTDFLRVVGYSEGDFPIRTQGLRLDDSYLGQGRYLGQKEKYVVLVFAHAPDLRRYAHEYLGADVDWPFRHDLGWGQGLMFVTALDMDDQGVDDTALHCAVSYSLFHNFCDGFRGYLFETPVWFKTGLAQWYARGIDPRHPQFDRPPGRRGDGRLVAEWDKRAKGLAQNDAARPVVELVQSRDYAGFKFHDYVESWSLVDFLMSRGDVAMQRFLHRIKSPLWLTTGTVDWTAVLAQQDRALQEAFGFRDAAALGVAWKEWAKKK